MNVRFSSFVSTVFLPLLAALALSQPALAVVATSIHPFDALDSISISTDATFLSINPGLTPVVSNEDYSHTIGIEVDANTGTIRGYSGYQLDAARQVTRTANLIDTIAGGTEQALVGNNSGSIIYPNLQLGAVTVSDGFARVNLAVDGSFNYVNGTPALGLLGAVQLTVAPGGNQLAATSYLFGGQVSNVNAQNLIPDANNLSTREDLQVFDGLGNVLLNPVLDDVTFGTNFISLQQNALSMIVSLMVPVQAGDTLLVGGTASGSATHSFLEDFRNIGVGDTGDVAAAEGFVDFLNTAQLGIELSEGFVFEGDNLPPASIVTTLVPLPAAAWLFGSALGLLGWARRKKA